MGSRGSSRGWSAPRAPSTCRPQLALVSYGGRHCEGDLDEAFLALAVGSDEADLAAVQLQLAGRLGACGRAEHLSPASRDGLLIRDGDRHTPQLSRGSATDAPGP